MKKSRKRPKITRGGGLSGPVKGLPASAKAAAANRTKNWKHGRYAEVVTPREGRAAVVEKTFGAGASEVMAGYEDAIGGNMGALDQISMCAMSESELIRRRLVDQVAREGAVVDEAIIGPDGEVRSDVVRKKAHPGLEHIERLNLSLGHTAQDLLLSRKSRGDTAKDLMEALNKARATNVRAADKSRLPAADKNLFAGAGAR